ncbi:putative squalene synthase [Neolecta irregularis DAH-3]|uniref:Squalene synthase n=1 Tax=Neolecta irregularis (strain DAH-3) TaxID=1198029 RepID=A0A1U7LQS7_NEOID|nr:putative squalene synthase [Neolecta irregularis DAH-3]|eukprot:OLL25026.1 putative squalene synthase [Neolecta irregularis DAH-3]
MSLLSYLLRPSELRAIVQYKLYYSPLNRRIPELESTTRRRCYEFLVQTSRSFSSVIQELKPELREPVCCNKGDISLTDFKVMIFYLILRGLDTIEDDMTIPIETKLRMLPEFHTYLSGPNEKDRRLLVEFDTVLQEYATINPQYQEVIRKSTERMGKGMAAYIDNADHNKNGINTIRDYDVYCHYVAGLVGEGLSQLFAASGLEDKRYADMDDLSNSMGLFLQKTNIIRDYREDLDDGRRFWPKEIWSKYANDLSDFTDPKNEESALACLSDMVLDALEHSRDSLVYLCGLKDQSIFNFCAIPQVMAIATLALVFRNRNVFHTNVKIRKGQACDMIMKMGNQRVVAQIFLQYVREIHFKNTPKDPNFLKISIECAKVEQWYETVFPRNRVPKCLSHGPVPAGEQCVILSPEEQAQIDKDTRIIIFAAVCAWLAIGGLMLFVAWCFGADIPTALKSIPSRLFKTFDSTAHHPSSSMPRSEL